MAQAGKLPRSWLPGRRPDRDLPQLTAVARIRGGEEEVAVRLDRPPGMAAARAGSDVRDRPRPRAGPVASPELLATGVGPRSEIERTTGGCKHRGLVRLVGRYDLDE